MADVESSVAATAKKRVLYFADPMCSWCWGFSPVIAAIRGACQGGPPIRFCAGGLRAGETRPLTAASRGYVEHHWHNVETATGQPFDYGFFDREAFVYDTLPSCRAVVAVRSLAPEGTLLYLAAVQRAFYAENRDVTREDILAAIARDLGIPEDVFLPVYRSSEILESTRADIRLTQGLGIQGFPAIVLQNGESLAALTIGYRPFEDMKDDLLAWLAAPPLSS
ncbi:MAG: DsbA family protein [Rhodospirillales bacterium]|nr:DsbA family protein [Rhodospirillales bacterium]